MTKLGTVALFQLLYNKPSKIMMLSGFSIGVPWYIYIYVRSISTYKFIWCIHYFSVCQDWGPKCCTNCCTISPPRSWCWQAVPVSPPLWLRQPTCGTSLWFVAKWYLSHSPLPCISSGPVLRLVCTDAEEMGYLKRGSIRACASRPSGFC